MGSSFSDGTEDLVAAGSVDRLRQLRSRARAVLLWACLAFVACQAGFRLVLRYQPTLGDCEFGTKLTWLRGQQAAEPERALILLLGSSRAVTGFCPEVLAESSLHPGHGPLLFNFAQTGAGPVLTLLGLHRLLNAGIRPDHLLIEYWPAHWYSEYATENYTKAALLNLSSLDWPLVRLAGRYAEHRRKLYRDWVRSQLWPLVSNRRRLMTLYAAKWLPSEARTEDLVAQLTPSGWRRLPEHFTAAERADQLEYYRKIYQPRLQQFHARGLSDRALRETLRLCQRHGIKTTLVLLPEAAGFRAWYPADADLDILPYLDGISREYGCPVVDARTWVADEHFLDGHHLLPAGATTFTERLGQEVLPRLLGNDRLVLWPMGLHVLHGSPLDLDLELKR